MCSIPASLGVAAGTAAAITVLWRFGRRGIMALVTATRDAPKRVGWLRETWLWIRYKPLMELTQRPTDIGKDIVPSTTRIRYATTFCLDLAPRHPRHETTVMLDSARLVLKQGGGSELRRVELARVPAGEVTLPRKPVIKSKRTATPVAVHVALEGFGNTLSEATNIDMDRPYRWEIKSVQAQFFGCRPRTLRSFKGKINPRGRG